MSARGRTLQAHRFIHVALLSLVAWQAAALTGVGRGVQVALGLLGFVFHVAFAKAYTLVPSYFDRELAVPRAPTVHLPLSAAGVALLAADGLGGPTWTEPAGAALWTAGVAVFVGALAWTVRDNPTGAETGTGDAKADRRAVDRAANAFVPVVLAYVAVGSYELLAASTGLPTLLDGYRPRTTHLLAAGGAALLIFAVGFRLLPRFLVAYPPRPLVAVVLPAGALGPALLAIGLPAGPVFHAGAGLQAVAVLGFAAAYARLYASSDRRRVGLYGVLAGVAAGAAAALLGLQFAVAGPTAGLAAAHARLNLLGFLGLTVVGATYQFYPPAAGRFRGASDRTALASILALAGGLALQAVGLAAGAGVVVLAGDALALAGGLVYAGLLVGLLRQMRNR
jgi:hypothetical protein